MSSLTIQSPSRQEQLPEPSLRVAPPQLNETALDRFQSALSRPVPAVEAATAPEPLPPFPPAEPIQPFDPATLMGGGWAVTFPAADPVTTSAPSAFHFKTQLVVAVASASAMGPSGDLSRRSAEGDAALAAYHQVAPAHQSLLEGVDAQFQPVAARVDLMD